MNPPVPPNSPVLRRRPSWRVRVLAVLISVGLAFLLAEGAMRIVGLDFASPYRPDIDCGSRLNPHAGFWNLSEGRVYVTTNSAGFRDREHAIKKPAGTFRIAVLGDSFSEAAQVKREDTFWSVMERQLQDCGAWRGQTVEVLNFGISGYGTAQELQMLRHHVWQYEPDIVLLAFLPGNDVRNNSRELEPDRGRPFFDLIDGQLVLDESFRDAPEAVRFRESPTVRIKDFLLRNVRVLSAVYRAKERLKERWQPVAAANGEAGLDHWVFVPPRDAQWERGWAITEGIIGLMHEEVRAHGANFLVVELNNAVQVHPDPAFIAAAAKRMHADDVDEPDRRLQRLSEERGFPFVSLTAPMRSIAQRDQMFFHGFPNTSPGSGHWNEQGHAVAGKLIAEALCQPAP
ncbi:MAG: SGNH/GDSL hydrolase family protein [Planctomycetaceae bacterium]|nr:SGNH/GDSL hydrolase family protein [Planctomycetaceae bacterium]